MRLTDELDVRNPDKRLYSRWSTSGYFYTDFRDQGEGVRERPEQLRLPSPKEEATHLPEVELLSPANGSVVGDPEILMEVRIPPESDERLEVVFELDTDPTFRGDFFQGSVDIPMFFEIYWRDLTYTGDGVDDDLDGVADEEVWNQKDDDGDGEVDEDTHHPLGGEKWPILVLGTVFSLVLYAGLGLFGMPMFFVWGFIRAVATVGAATFFTMFTEVIGALLAKYYFWPKYGKQQWRRYAMILAVGYGVGLSLSGMACSALQMIKGAISATPF